MLSVSSTGRNNEQQSFAKLSYSAIKMFAGFQKGVPQVRHAWQPRWHKLDRSVHLLVFAYFHHSKQYPSFLANVNSRSRSLFAVARPSVVCRL